MLITVGGHWDRLARRLRLLPLLALWHPGYARPIDNPTVTRHLPSRNLPPLSLPRALGREQLHLGRDPGAHLQVRYIDY